MIQIFIKKLWNIEKVMVKKFIIIIHIIIIIILNAFGTIYLVFYGILILKLGIMKKKDIKNIDRLL